MTARIDTPKAKKNRAAARRRLWREIAHNELVQNGTPKGQTMRFLSRSHASSLGNRRRWARERKYVALVAELEGMQNRVAAQKQEEADRYAHEHPPMPGMAHMRKGIAHQIERMTYHERMERARLGLAPLLMNYRLTSNFTVDTFVDWKRRTLRALTYQRLKYRALEGHSEAQAEAHVLLELAIDFIRQGSEPLLQKWLHERQVAERDERLARLKLHNPTAGSRI